MGGRAHGVDLAGPLALDGVRLAAGLGDQARPRAGGRVRARRGAGRGRRARRHSGPDAPEREPQHHREDGRDHRARSDRARAACRRRSRPRRCPRSWCCPTCGARSRTCSAPSRSSRRTARTAMWCRSSIRPRRPSRSPAASSSSSRRTGTRSRPAAPRPGATSTRSALERHRAEIRAETDRLGWSFTIHRTDRPASELLLRAAHARWAPGRAAAGINRWREADAAGRRRMIAGLPLAFAQPLVLLGLLSLPVLWWLLRLVPPRPRRAEARAGKAAARHRAEGRDAGAHAVVADAAAPDARGAADHRGRRTAVESAARDLAGVRAARAADRRRLGRGRHLGHARAHRRRPDRARRDRQSRRRDHPAVGARPRHLAGNAGRRARAAAPAQAEAAHRSTAPRRCRRSRASSPPRRTIEVLWLSDGVDVAKGAEFVAELAQAAAGQVRHRGRGRRRAARMRSPPPTTRPARSP